MALLFIIGFFLWVWAELAMLVAIGSEVGVLLTIAGIFVTAMIGVWLLRSQGRMIIATLQAQIARGEAPVASLAAGVSVMGGAVMMLIPGYITDGIGLVMFLPVIRTIIGAYLLKAITSRGHVMMRGGTGFGSAWQGMGSRERGTGETPFQTGRHQSDDDDVIEGDFEERHPDQDRLEK